MTRVLDVIIAGEVFIDLILSGFDIWPRLGQEAFAQEYRREIGGGTAITACGLANLGLRTAVLAALGSEGGQWVAQRLAGFGVDTSPVTFDCAEPTGFTLVATMTEDRAFLTYRGANRSFATTLMAAAQAGELSTARHVHLAFAPCLDGTSEAAGALIDSIRANGCTISLDTGWHEKWLGDARAMDIIRQVDIFFPNEIEASRLTKKVAAEAMLEEFDRQGVRCVALKLGRQGCALLLNGKTSFVPAFSADAVDTTGAGDCFDAGFLYGWLNGMDDADCLLSGNICGALSTERYGGLSGFPSLEDLQLKMQRAQK